VINKDNIFFVTTNRDLHFTDQLARGASEYENIVVSGAGKLSSYITSIRVTMATLGAVAVSFYSRDVFYQRLAATPYANALIDYWQWASADATAAFGPLNVISATEWVYAVTGLKIPYVDEDETGELHVGLHNLSHNLKLAAANTDAADYPAGVATQYVSIRFGLISEAS
jgi:hypothetical protein